MPPSFDVELLVGPPRMVLRVQGDLDICSTGELSRALCWGISQLADVPGGSLSLDLTGLAFLDCAGLTALVAGCSAAENRHVPFTACGARGEAQRILALTGVDVLLCGRFLTSKPNPRIVGLPC